MAVEEKENERPHAGIRSKKKIREIFQQVLKENESKIKNDSKAKNNKTKEEKITTITPIHITRNQFAIVLEKLGMPVGVAKKNVNELFDSLDYKHSGYLDEDEVVFFVEKYEQNIYKSFKMMDTKNVGYLDRESLRNGLDKLGIHCSEHQLDVAFRKCDLNHDGTIDFQDYLSTAAFLTELAPKTIISQLFSFDIHVPNNTTSNQVILAGLVAGAVSRTLTAPMDRLRGLQSAGNTSTLGSGKQTNSIIFGLRSMYAKGGIKAFFQGNGMNVLQVGPESAITFFLFDYFKRKYAKDPSNLTSWDKFVYGGSAGALAMIAVYPCYVIQNRLCVAPEGYYKGIIDCTVKTVQLEGMGALAKGFLPSIIRVVPLRGLDMLCFNTLKDKFVGTDQEITPIQSLGFGAVTAVISQSATYPLMLVRTKLQTQGEAGGRPALYTGMVDCLKQTIQKEGFIGLYAGLKPTLFKMVPAVALSFASYEKTIQFCHHYNIK